VSVHKVDYFVIPAKAGIQNRLKSLDSRFHGNDGKVIYKQTLFINTAPEYHVLWIGMQGASVKIRKNWMLKRY